MSQTIESWWWEEDDFLYRTEDGKITRLVNTYPASIKFEGLDSSPTDEVTINTTWERTAK